MSTASNKIARRPFMAELLGHRGKALIVTGLGSPSWDCCAAGDSDEYLYSWGAMGLAVPTALGVALAQPSRRVVCVTNFPPRRIATFESEVLTLGAIEGDGRVVLLKPDADAELGSPIG